MQPNVNNPDPTKYSPAFSTNLLWRLLHLLNALSIDVAIGAVTSSLFAARLLKANLPLSWWWLLGGAVWVIYTTDHLLDAARGASQLVAFRHRLHLNWWRELTISGLLVGVGCILGAVMLPVKLLIFGIVLSVVMIAYLIGAYTDKLSLRGVCVKEPLVAIIYATGIWGGPILSVPIATSLLYPLIAFADLFLLALANLYIISFLERESDVLLGVSSAARDCSPDTLKGCIHLLAVVALGFALTLILTRQLHLVIAGLTLGTMAIAHSAIMYWYRRLRHNSLYRIMLDSTFIIPPLVGAGMMRGW